MSEQMKFPVTFEEFAKEYGFKDDKEVYTNGSDLIPIFRVKQWLEHDNKLRKIETDTAYECGKHANRWISVSEMLPPCCGMYIVTRKIYDCPDTAPIIMSDESWFDGHNTWHNDNRINHERRYLHDVIAWMPLPEPYREVEE